MNYKKVMLTGLVALSALALAGCKSSATTNQNTGATQSTAADEKGAVVISYNGTSFSPTEVEAKVGQKIIIKNMSSNNVQVNSAPHPTHTLFPELNLDVIAPNTSKSLSFSKAGTYNYHNHLVSAQGGTIVVK